MKPDVVRVRMRHVLNHSFRGVKFQVGVVRPRRDEVWAKNGLGATTSRRAPRPLMLLHADLAGPQALEVLIHEALHASFDRRLSEQDVTEAGRDIARFLWRLGYRHP